MVFCGSVLLSSAYGFDLEKFWHKAALCRSFCVFTARVWKKFVQDYHEKGPFLLLHLMPMSLLLYLLYFDNFKVEIPADKNNDIPSSLNYTC